VSSQAAGSRPASAATAPSAADGAGGGTGRFRGLRDRTSVKVGTLTAAAALIYCLDSLILFRRFLASTFDLVIFDQGIRGYSQVFADNGYVVLHRPADARTAEALAHPLPAARLHTNICY
jgi:hypothetical protein